MNATITQAKPFLKWAGGKTQLIPEIANIIPKQFKNENFIYIEPFVGSGAVLFWVLNHFPHLTKVVINDINTDLINVYRVIKYSPDDLIEKLRKKQDKFILLGEDKEQKKEYYYQEREMYNQRISDDIEQAALFIFLNRTCFNGLYRVNRSGSFNVPMGDYKNPTICDEENIQAVHRQLQKVTILNGDYQEVLKEVNKDNALFYFDPPYRPLTETSSFNAYAKDVFDDVAQIRLAEFCKYIDRLGYKWILSNSDPKNINPEDQFFDELYQSFLINRVLAKRMINAKADKRGVLTELLITNNGEI
ncbi:DNA adenine methylase [Pelistega ratti]|uniref:DNA adenine methylase n=1 Tax=Pelistega ratti TaxID=2652177 RepID=UPI001357B9FB|nr:DNA adenine methylase [Pelistega ratti]